MVGGAGLEGGRRWSEGTEEQLLATCSQGIYLFSSHKGWEIYTNHIGVSFTLHVGSDGSVLMVKPKNYMI